MRYITSVERIGMQKGIQLGIQQGVQRGQKQGALQNARESVLEVLQVRFQNEPLLQPVAQMVNSINDSTLLKRLLQQSIFVESVQTFQQQLAEAKSAQ